MTEKENEGIKVSLKDFVMRYLRYLPWILLSVSIALVLAYTYLRYTVPLYNAHATLMIKTSAPQGRDQELDNMFFSDSRNNVGTEIEVLRSLNLAKRVAASLGLQKRNYVEGNVKTALSYPKSPLELDIIRKNDTTTPIAFRIYVHNETEFSFDGPENPKYNFGQNFENGAGVFKIIKNDSLFNNLQYKEHTLTWEPLQSTAYFVLGGLQVAPISDGSNILQLSYISAQPELGKDILDQLMIEYQKLNVEDKRLTTSNTINFINERLNLITRELGDVEKDLQDYKRRNKITNLVAQSQVVVGSLTDLEKQITNQEVRKQILDYLRDYLSNDNNQHQAVPTSLGISEPSLLQQINQYNDIQTKRETALKSTTANNILVTDLQAQAEKIRRDIIETLKNLKVTYEIELNSLKRKSLEYNSSISSVPIREKELLEITRQQGIKQTLYLFLLQKREESAISIAATIANSKVVDQAIPGYTPVKPQPTNVKIIAIFLGLVVPVGLIYLLELLNDKVRSRADINRVTKAPIFGEIGHADIKGTLLVHKNNRDVVTEQFRMIRTNIKYLVNNNVQTPVVMVTSTFSGEGKSFISINTGAVVALAGKKTVVLEFDIRKPKISKGLNLSSSQGLTNYLVSDIPVESLPVPVPDVDNLYVIPCGPIPPNPAEMLLNEKLPELFRFVRSNFEVVIVDTAPAGLVSDAFTLSQYADSTLYIVRMGYTLKKQIHFIDELYSKSKLPSIGLLVNDIKASSQYYSYGNYGGYGYGYGHGSESGYFDNGKKKRRGLSRFFRRLFRFGRG
jgi:tyrosine-protein kinase Etk/Wzc